MISPPPTADLGSAWHVLVVSANLAHVAAARRVLASWPVPVVVSVASSAMAAMRRALSQPPRLVIVDWAVDGPSGQALVSQLARLRPALPVLPFDVLQVVSPSDRTLTWPWEELPSVLARWLAPAIEREAQMEDRS